MASPAEKIAAAFAVPDPPAFDPRDDIRPSTPIAVIALRRDGRTRGLAFLRWGLVPHWSQTEKPKHIPINIRSESALDKFGHQVRHNRCLIPADGFYEWAGEKKKRRKYQVSMRDGSPFAFAGVWDVWQGDKQKLVTCAFLTTSPNELIKPYHDSPTHFAYEWNPDSDLAHMVRSGVFPVVRRADGHTAVSLPEMHVWLGCSESEEIIDFTTGLWPAACQATLGIGWTAERPPEYLWTFGTRLPKDVRYIASKEAIEVVIEILRQQGREYP